MCWNSRGNHRFVARALKNTASHRHVRELQLLCPVLPGRWLQAQGFLHVPKNICNYAQSHWERRRKFKISEGVPNIVPWICLWESAVVLSKGKLVQKWNFNLIAQEFKTGTTIRKGFLLFHIFSFLLPTDNYQVFIFFQGKIPQECF